MDEVSRFANHDSGQFCTLVARPPSRSFTYRAAIAPEELSRPFARVIDRGEPVEQRLVNANAAVVFDKAKLAAWKMSSRGLKMSNSEQISGLGP
jgi:hypothetical protein